MFIKIWADQAENLQNHVLKTKWPYYAENNIMFITQRASSEQFLLQI